MAEFRDRFETFLRSLCGPPQEYKFLLAVSGGRDSMTMLHLFRTCELDFAVAHMNFGLRGKESEGDEQFLSGFCEDKNITFFSRKENTKKYASDNGFSVQMAARELRYAWFNKISSEGEFDFICTAHHLDDDAETVLLNLVRGTGISGLTGIPARRDRIVRPMLEFSREEIEMFSDREKLEWRQDSSNAQTGYRRNLLRHELMPVIAKLNPGFLDTFRDTRDRLLAANEFLGDHLADLSAGAVHPSEESIRIRKSVLEPYPPFRQQFLLSGILQPFGFSYRQCGDLVPANEISSGKIFESPTHRLICDREEFILVDREHSQENGPVTVNRNESSEVSFGGRTYEMKIREKPADWNAGSGEGVWQLDADKLKWPLTWRSREEGDRFKPLGMRGKKKISDFMIDRKIPVNLKQRAAIVVSGNTVAAILPYEVGEEFKITPSTKLIAEIREISK